MKSLGLGDLGAGRRKVASEKIEGLADLPIRLSECQKLPRICPTWICPIREWSLFMGRGDGKWGKQELKTFLTPLQTEDKLFVPPPS